MSNEYKCPECKNDLTYFSENEGIPYWWCGKCRKSYAEPIPEQAKPKPTDKPNPDRIMTDEQLMGLHDDIRDGVTATITVKHLHDLENAIRDLIEAFNHTSMDKKQHIALQKAAKLIPAKDRQPPPKGSYSPKDYPLRQEPTG